MNKQTFLIMSSEIPVYPQQPIIDIGTIAPGPSPSGLRQQYDYLLETISQEDLESNTPTLSSIFTEIERRYHEGILPTGYQYYFWFYEFELDEELATGLKCNELAYGSSPYSAYLILTPKSLETGQSIGVRIYFIYHPTNYTSTSTQTEWYIGIARDNTPKDLEIYINNTYSTVSSYHYSNDGHAKTCNIGLLPITAVSTERMYPQTGIKLFGSQRLPIDIS